MPAYAQRHLTVVILLASVAACGSSPLQISAIQLGRTLNADQSVAEFDTVFSPKEPIHLSVLTTGGGSGTIGVRWMYRGSLIGESTKSVANRDFAATNFPLQTTGGFPPGEYSAEVFLDGKPVGTKTFKVQVGR